MSDFLVPAAAVEAGRAELHRQTCRPCQTGQPCPGSLDSDAVLAAELAEVMGPYIAAAALRQAADDRLKEVRGAVAAELAKLGPGVNVGHDWDGWQRQVRAVLIGAWLRLRADKIDGRQPQPDDPEAIAARMGTTVAEVRERQRGGQPMAAKPRRDTQWERVKAQRAACPNVANHTEGPDGYIAASNWAEEMAETHDQSQCPGCRYWVIWTQKPEASDAG